MADEPYNAADAQKVKDKGLDEKAYRKRLRADLSAILKTAEGRRYIWHILEDCHIFDSIYSTSHPEMSFREGRRQIGLQLLQEVEAADETALIQMLQAKVAHGNQP